MNTNDLIKSVISENIVESKNIATELLLKKLSERLQEKFEEFAPQNFLDEEEVLEEENLEEKMDPVGEEDEDINNDGKEDDQDEYLKKRRAAIAKSKKSKMNEAKKEKEEEEEEEGEEKEGEEEEEEKGEYGTTKCEDGNCYEDGDINDSNEAEEMNRKAFHKPSMNEDVEQLDEKSPEGMKHMTHSKKATASFKSQYGKKGNSVKYATAWKMSKSKKEE